MKNRHITRFGSPISPSGAFYFACDEEGLIQMDVDTELAQLYFKGVQVNADVQKLVAESVLRNQRLYHDKVNIQGIPGKFKVLFQCTKKADAEKHCKSIEVSEYELFLLIHNSSQLGFTHRSKFPQYVPDHLNGLDEEREKLKNDDPHDFFRKTDAVLKERRFIQVHLFEKGAEWHCFYFSYDDIDPEETNHWNRGSHLHYVSHLWPNHDKDRIWEYFDTRTTKIAGNLHIKFLPFEFNHSCGGDESNPTTHCKRPPGAVAFEPELASGNGLAAIPVAHLATRGLWMVTFRMR